MGLWIYWGKRPPVQMPGGARIETKPAEGEQGSAFPEELLWLADAPLFIDGRQVEAFYDAVLRPNFMPSTVTVTDSISRERSGGGTTTIGAAIPGLAKAELGASAQTTTGEGRSQEVGLDPVTNPYRHLIELTTHYVQNKSDRLVLPPPQGGLPIDEGEAQRWMTDEFIRKTPRALFLAEFTEGTMFIPTALEAKGGKVTNLLDLLGPRLARHNEAAPEYPGSKANAAVRRAYWTWFVDHFNDRAAGEIIEEHVASDQRIEWLDFRVPLRAHDGSLLHPLLHLHVAPRSKYATGIFAYNLVNRGFKHGVRIVGTLKSEPDLNVLAIFDR